MYHIYECTQINIKNNFVLNVIIFSNLLSNYVFKMAPQALFYQFKCQFNENSE